MTTDDVRDGLRVMRRTHSAGCILGLLSEVVQEEADAEFLAGDLVDEELSRLVAAALHATGLGVDAIRLRPRRTP
jgi:hypothetical protein